MMSTRRREAAWLRQVRRKDRAPRMVLVRPALASSSAASRLEHERDDHRHRRGPEHDPPGRADPDPHLPAGHVRAVTIPGGKPTDRYGRKRCGTIKLVV